MAISDPYLTKSRFMAGWQCHKRLWLTVHEPGAEELRIDVATQDLFDQSREVEQYAHRQFPGGVLVGWQQSLGARLEKTRLALASDAPAIFEATFAADGVQVRVDILQRVEAGYALIEVKSSSELKDKHIPDAAIQAWVLRQSGFIPQRIEILYLNRGFRHPAEGELFIREDVTQQVAALLAGLPGAIEEQLAALRGAEPRIAISEQCRKPDACPFIDRCWPEERFHVTRLYRGRPKGLALMQSGIELIHDIPASQKLTDTQQRQKRSAAANGVVVEPALAAALEQFTGRLGFLDFETIARAIPVWPGTRPWQQTVVQFSYHEELPAGGHSHVGYLAEGPADPREDLVEAMLKATRNADRIVMYSSFERSRIRDLQDAVPSRRAELVELEGKLVDLLPVLQDNVYHPDFRGSFSLKYTLTPLVPHLTYSDLMIQEGRTASVEIWRLLFVAHLIPPAQRDKLRQDLLEYCKRDTLATVELLAALRRLANPGPPQLTLI